MTRDRARARPAIAAAGQPYEVGQVVAIYPPARRTVTAEWRDPDDTNPLHRQPRVIRGERRYSVIAALHKRNPAEITEAMVTAATRLLNDVEAAGSGSAVVAQYGHAAPRAGVWAGKPSDRAVDAVGRVRAASEALAGVMGVVAHVVVGNRALKSWAAGHRPCLNETLAKGYLIAALSVLVEHYERVDGGRQKKSQGRAFSD